eukprot:3126220-Alexandrium_andersonii.AAC.1
MVARAVGHRTGAKLIRTGLRPAVEYGAAGFGVAPSTVVRLRRQCVQAIGIKNQQGCPTTILHLLLGAWADPALSMPVCQIREWLRIPVSYTHLTLPTICSV